MYSKINDYPVQDFCDWYNKKYNSNIRPDTIEFELSCSELEQVADIMVKELGEYVSKYKS